MNMRFDIKKPYPHMCRNIASEILQLLLVVERIKSDKDSYQRLKLLAKIKEGFDGAPEIKSLKNTFSPYKGDLPISTLCEVLDDGLGVTSFSSKSLQFTEGIFGHRSPPTTVPKIPEEHQWSKVWMEDIPAVIDSQHYRFENLNEWRLHYPHLQILLAYVNGKELLLLVSDLMALDYAKCAKSAEEWAMDKFSRIFKDNNEDLLPPMLAQHVTNRANCQYLDEINKIIRRVNKHLNRFDEIAPYFPYPEVLKTEKEWKNALGCQLGEQPILRVDLLQADVQRAIEERELGLIANKIASSLAQAAQPNGRENEAIYGIEFQKNLMEIYEVYCTGKNQLLWHANNELQLNYRTLLRGLGFSIWREKNQKKEGYRSTVLKDTETFLTEEKNKPYCFGKSNTIKQSYEAVKGYAKRRRNTKQASSLVKLIHSQMDTRLSFYTPEVCYVFAPFNMEYEVRVRKIIESLGHYFDISQLHYYDICELFHSLIGNDIPKLQKDDLVKALEEKGLELYDTSYSAYKWGDLPKIFRKDIWVGD